MCNQTVKFGTFARRAFLEGADFVATGHYARVTCEPAAAPGMPARTHLLRAADEHKDQTYFLWRVGEATLARTLFPIGDIPTKAQVRRMCAERGLGVEAKPDSDGICFIGPVGIRNFLLSTLERRAGDIVEWETGRVLGGHDGAFLFTVGQRKGLGIGGGPKRYVVATDVDTNTVYATADPACPALWTRRVLLTDVRWIHGEPPAPGNYLVRSRHTGDLRPARVTPFSPAPPQQALAGEKNAAGEKSAAGEKGSASVLVEYAEPVRTVAPGQSAVIYDGLECLGGGIIARPELRPPRSGVPGELTLPVAGGQGL
jgi:tRNA-specific 2-thiouridylase